MIYYNHDREVITDLIAYEPRSCFVMTKLGDPIPNIVDEIRKELKKELDLFKIKELDANSYIQGRDFLNKIWRQLIAVPFGIAIITEEMPMPTIANIFYELGVLNSLGKETIVIKTEKIKIPSDFVRTEYILFDNQFQKKIKQFLNQVFELADHYELMGENLEANPILTIDYYKRAYLITGDNKYFDKTKEIVQKHQFDQQTMHFIKDFLSMEKRLKMKKRK